MQILPFLFIFSAASGGAALAAEPPPSALPELLQYAMKNNALYPTQQAQLNALEGKAQSAEATFFNNPVIDWSGGKKGPTAGNPEKVQQNEWGLGISQTFEIAGQQGYRQDIARLSMNTFQAASLDTRNELRLITATLFYKILALQEKVRLENEAVALYSRAEALVSQQITSGSATRLDNNLATIERHLAENQLLVARQSLQDTRSELARFLLLSEDIIPELQGELDATTSVLPYTYNVLEQQLANTPKRRQLAWQEKQATAELKLQKAARVPDITLGIRYSQDGPGNQREDLTTLSVSVPLPLFQRNEEAIGAAVTALTRSQLALDNFQNEQRQQLKNQWSKLDNLKKRAAILNDQILPVTQMNKRLTRVAQEYGQNSLPDILLASQQILTAQRNRLDTLLDYQTTRLAVENLANWPAERAQ